MSAPRPLRIGAALFLCSGLLPTGLAQSVPLPVAFDLKPAGTPAQPGMTAVSPGNLFNAATDFGFTAPPVDALLGGGPGHDVVDRDDDERALFAGCIRVANGTAFAVRIAPNQKVRIRCTLALVPPITALADTTGSGFAIVASKGGGTATVASGIALRTPYKKVDLTTLSGSYRKLWFSATSAADGVLRLTFQSTTGAPVPIAAIEIHPFAAAPLIYQRLGATWLQPTGGAGVPGLAAFHAHDCAAASAGFLTITDPLLRAHALAWLAGWLCADADGHADLLAPALSALADPALIGNGRARELRDRIEDVQLGELHFGLRLYSKGSLPPPAGLGYFNTSLPGTVLANPPAGISDLERHDYLAETLFAQIAGLSVQPILDFNAGNHTDPDQEVAPLTFLALDRIARIHYGHNPNHTIGAAAQPQLAIWEGIWQAWDNGGFLAGEFDGAAEPAVLAYMARPEVHQHTKTGGLQQYYTGTDVPTSYLLPAEAWWTAALTLPSANPPGAPGWAIELRRVLLAERAAATWWLEQRAQDGEFGGGPGDDPELVPQLLLPFLVTRAPGDDAYHAGISLAADAILDGGSVADGYYAGPITDVEHTAEFTTYPLLTSLLLRAGDPHALQACLDVAKHLRYATSPTKAWCADDAMAHLRFRSYWFNTDGPADTGLPQYLDKDRDVPLCGRAIVPLHLFVAHSPQPAIDADLSSWAAGWLELAMHPQGTRPDGLVPAAVRFSDLSQGHNGSWWLAGASGYDFPANLFALDHIYGAAFDAAYRAGGAEAWRYLLPILRLAQQMIALQALIDQGVPPADVNTVGAKNWAIAQLLNSTSFLATLALQRPALLADPVLTTSDDPTLPGSEPYVTPAFASALGALLTQLDAGYQTYLTTPQEFQVGAGWQNKQKGGLIASITKASRWLTNYFPLATTAVRYTDRSNLFILGSNKTFFGMLTGGHFGSPVPSHVVTWETMPADPAPLDVAVLVNDLGQDTTTGHPRLRILAYGFDAGPRQLAFRLWHRLPFGRYHLRVGAAGNSSDYFTGGFTSTDIDFTRRGDLFGISLTPATLTLLELEWFQSLPATPAFDLALSSKDATLQWVAGGPLGATVRVTQPVANTGDQASPGGALKVQAGLRDPSGVLLPLTPSGDVYVDVPASILPGAIPPFSGYVLPTSNCVFDLPILAPLIPLWLAGYAVELRFVTTVADADAGNDAALSAIDLPALLKL